MEWKLNILLLVLLQKVSAWTYTRSSDDKANIVVNAFERYQEMVGGGCSGAFGIACQMFGSEGLSPENQQKLLQTLFDENIGGLSVVRNEIRASAENSILQDCPNTPAGPFNYVWNGNDSCQVELTKTARKYSPELYVYADAWSAPGCMKTDKSENNGGFICGVVGTDCEHDWRQAYADYLVQYVKFYKQEGIDISLLGAWNEPDYNPITYASMLSDGFQAKDFLEVLYPTVKRHFPELDVSCCDATGARQENGILYEVMKAGGECFFDVATWHNYQSSPKGPFLAPGKANLMTEWTPGSGPWNTTWDVTGQMAEGFQWAQYLHRAIVTSDTSGYNYWWCAQQADNDESLIRLDGDAFEVSARLWAFASYFRFARPGSVRIGATSDVETIYVTAFVNKNGTVAIPVINRAHFAFDVTITLAGLRVSRYSEFLTDNSHNVTLVKKNERLWGFMLRATVEPRAVKTFWLE